MMDTAMAGLLPTGMRCSAFWYAQARGLPADLGYLKALGATAARMAFWEGLEPWQVPEGPYWVFMWPERIWDAAAMGTGVPALTRFWSQPPPPGYGFWSYPPPPEGTMAYDDWCRMADEEGRRDAAWMSADGDPEGYGDPSGQRDAGWGPGQVPWDGDDIRAY